MDIIVAGVPFDEWKYMLPQWWTIRNPESYLPRDGSARLLHGTHEQISHLQETGHLITNMVGAHSSDYGDCDLPIYGLCFIAP